MTADWVHTAVNSIIGFGIGIMLIAIPVVILYPKFKKWKKSLEESDEK